MKLSFLVIVFVATVANGAMKINKCSAELVAFASQIKWQPDTVHPDLSLPLIVMLNSGPNTWVQFGKPEGKSFYQRGYDNGYDGSTNLPPSALQAGGELAMKLMAGKLDARENDFSILSSFKTSEKFRVGINQNFASPLMVRGKFAQKYKTTSPDIDSPDPNARARSLPGNLVTPATIESMGLFNTGTDSYKERYFWTSNYLRMVDGFKEKGFEFLPGSEGEKFYLELKDIWASREFLYSGGDKAKMLPNDIRNKSSIDDALKTLFKKKQAVTVTTLLE